MKNEREIGKDFKLLEEKTFESICHAIEGYNGTLRNHLVCIVSRLCNVPQEDIFSNTKNLDVVRARWLFWYAYRYMTDATYDSMATQSLQTRKFTRVAINQGVSKMAMMISDTGSVWAKRWSMIKRIIHMALQNSNEEDKTLEKNIVLKITTPKGVKIDVQSEERNK